MGFYKFIRLKGPEAARTGYFVPRLYRLPAQIGLKIFGLQFVKMCLEGWTIWWVENEADYIRAKETLTELKKTRIFDFSVNK